jgi:hypothetical protein
MPAQSGLREATNGGPRGEWGVPFWAGVRKKPAGPA